MLPVEDGLTLGFPTVQRQKWLMLCPIPTYTWWSCKIWPNKRVSLIGLLLKYQKCYFFNTQTVWSSYTSTMNWPLDIKLLWRQEVLLICSHTNEMSIFLRTLKDPEKTRCGYHRWHLFIQILTANMSSSNPIYSTAVVTYSGSLRGSIHLVVGALVDLSPYPWRQINKNDLE